MTKPTQRAGGDETPEALKESREWLRVTLSSIGDAVITTDARGHVTFLNPVAEALTGWTNEQAADLALPMVFRIVNEDTRKEVENPALRALREGLVVGLANHTLLISRDGTERPIDDSAAPIRNGANEIAGTVLVFRDITQRKQQERTVQAALDYAVNILATLRHAFLVLDKDLRVVSANRAFYARFQVDPASTEGRFVYDLGNRQWDIPRLRELLEEILPRNHSFEDFEIDHEFESVGRKVMALNARRVHQPGIHSELILLVIEDITDRRMAEQALQESELRYRRLFESAKDGVLLLDARTGKVIDANAFMSGLTGLDHAELLGKELYELGMFKDIEENKQAFLELQRTHYLRQDHLPVQNQRGERVEVEFVANVYHEDHRLVAQCNVRDIRQRVEMEKKIQEQTEQLASESRRKDEFLAMLSHELRNPLAPIRSAVHLLRLNERGTEDLIQKQAHDIIERQVANLTKLVSDLLEVSRVVSGRIRLNQLIIDANQVVRHAAETARPVIDHHKHELTLHLCDDPMWISADPTRLEEVLINLLNNAAKFTPYGGRIDVNCSHPRGTNYVELRVRDSGIGIEEKVLPRIFDLFTQADRSLDRAAGGLGVGLSLAHRLIDLHGGTIEARSEGPGRGSEFVVHLPLVVGPELPQAEPPKEEGRAKPDGQRVLVVDDNVDQVMMLAATLRQQGYIVESAYTGPDGFSVAQRWKPDIVLLDIGLPGLDGYEVARRLRADPALGSAGKKMRIIALTGYGRDTDVALAREAGFDGHLVKPYDFAELERLIAITARQAP